MLAVAPCITGPNDAVASTRTRTVYRRGPNRPSVHELCVLAILPVNGLRVAGVHEAGIDLVEWKRKQMELVECAGQRVMWAACRLRLRHCRGGCRSLWILDRWAGPEAISAGECFCEAVQPRGVDSSEAVQPVDSSEINESLSNGHQTWGDGRTARLQDYALVNYFNVGTRIDS
jgi:hypothetical protein